MEGFLIMEKLKCKVKGCDKVVEGYTKKHVEFLMAQHMLKHQREDAERKKRK